MAEEGMAGEWPGVWVAPAKAGEREGRETEEGGGWVWKEVEIEET